MAQKARKDLAKSNTTTLNNLHLTSLTLNLLFLALHFLFFRRRTSLFLYILFSLPAFACQYILEISGRPKYTPTAPGSSSSSSSSSTATLKSPGQDLAASGLTEYMFDTVWITWAALVLVVLVGNWGWCVWGVVPAFALYKGIGLLGMARGLMGGVQGGKGVQGVDERLAAQQQQQQQQQGATPGKRRARKVAA